MNLPVSVLVLVALQAAFAKITNQKNNQTSKRELLEGNFGERKALLSKYASSGSPTIQYAEDINEELSDQSSAHQIFGARLPQISKISDVLTGQGPPFEVAVANHLYAPISVYQARLSSPTTFEIPSPAASQIAYSNSKSYKPRKQAEEQKPQSFPTKEVEQPRYNVNVPVYAVKQPRFRFESYPQPFAHGLPRPEQSPQNTYQQQPAPQFFPVFDETNRYTGRVVPPQYLQQPGFIQIVPYDPGYDYVNTEDKELANQESREEVKPVATEKPKLQNEIQQPKPGYHAHPNGAISFASFTQSLPTKTQQEAASQPNEAQIQQQVVQSSQTQSQQQLSSQTYAQNEQQQTKEGHHYPQIFQQYLQQLQKYYPFEQEVKFRAVDQSSPQLMTYNVPMRQQPRNLNPLRQQLLIENPQQFLQAIQFQRLPAFKPLPQARLASELQYQPTQTTTPTTTQEPVPQFKSLPQPKPFSFHEVPAQSLIHFNQPIVPVLPQRNLTPLPPLKPNYSHSVKPLTYHTPPAFLPTPVQQFSTSTPKLLSAPDQVISSTTIRPTVNQESTTDQEQKEQILQQTELPQPLEPEITYQSQPTVQPISVTAQPTTYRPSTAYEPHLEHVQQSTPQPHYQTTLHPRPTQTPPRHEVVIQQQELQELILEPSQQPINVHPHSQPRQQPSRFHQHEQELYQLQSQQHRNDLEQLQPQLHNQIVQELRSQQHQRDARQKEESLISQRQQLEKQIEFQQYQNHQRPQPQQDQFLQQQVPQQQQEQIQNQQDLSAQQIEAKENQQKLQLEPQDASQQQLSTPQSSDEPQKESELQSDDQQQTEPQTIDSVEQTEPSHTPSEPKPPIPNNEGAFFAPNYPIFQHIYTQPQELLVHPEYGSPLGINSLPDVQYFGKYAESLFGGLQH